MNFAWPYSFLLLAPLAFASWRMLRRARRSGVKFSAVANLPAKTAGWRARLSSFAPYILIAACALLTLAAARPRSLLGRSSRVVDAIAIVMTVDVSGSMAATDLTPRDGFVRVMKTRLDVVKEIFAGFVKARKDDLIGLVTFGGYASVKAPLTGDHEGLLHILKGVEIPRREYNAMGSVVNADETLTAIGDGLAVSLARIKDAPVKSKVIILLSDGRQVVEDAIDPEEAARAAKKYGVKIYSIGVGTDQGDFDEEQLKSIASITGARYFHVSDRKALADALSEIDSMEKTRVEVSKYERYSEYFTIPLVAGAILAALAVTLQMAASRRVA